MSTPNKPNETNKPTTTNMNKKFTGGGEVTLQKDETFIKPAGEDTTKPKYPSTSKSGPLSDISGGADKLQVEDAKITFTKDEATPIKVDGKF